MQSQPNGAVSAPATITIDRNARKTLLAALSLRLESHFESAHTTLRTRDRVLLLEAQEFFLHLEPILEGLEFWDEGGSEVPDSSYTIPASDWLRELMEDYGQQTLADHAGDEKWVSEVADKGEVEFNKGGSLYESENPDHPNRQRQDWLAKMRCKLEEDRDEMVGAQSILFAMLGVEAGDEMTGIDVRASRED